MKHSTLAAFAHLDPMSPQTMAAAAQRIEALGYSTLFFPNARVHNPLVQASILLSATTTLNVATGIAPIYDHSAYVAAAAQRALYDQSEGRFLLGLGVSHPVYVQGERKKEYGPPLSSMREYLTDLDAWIAHTDDALRSTPDAPTRASMTAAPMPRVIAALRPKMLELARDMCAGAHPYLVPPKHTSIAREILGPERLLLVEQKVVLQADPYEARSVARKYLAPYLTLPNYLKCWEWLGFDDSDFADQGSDRLVDALVVWGDESAIRRKLSEHLEAGADQVCVQALPSTLADESFPWKTFEVVSQLSL